MQVTLNFANLLLLEKGFLNKVSHACAPLGRGLCFCVGFVHTMPATNLIS